MRARASNRRRRLCGLITFAGNAGVWAQRPGNTSRWAGPFRLTSALTSALATWSSSRACRRTPSGSFGQFAASMPLGFIGCRTYHPELFRTIIDPPRPLRWLFSRSWDRWLGRWHHVVKAAGNLGYGGANARVIRNWPTLLWSTCNPARILRNRGLPSTRAILAIVTTYRASSAPAANCTTRVIASPCAAMDRASRNSRTGLMPGPSFPPSETWRRHWPRPISIWWRVTQNISMRSSPPNSGTVISPVAKLSCLVSKARCWTNWPRPGNHRTMNTWSTARLSDRADERLEWLDRFLVGPLSCHGTFHETTSPHCRTLVRFGDGWRLRHCVR